MGGVDRHDHLRSSFSLCKAHHFGKYCIKLFLFILDVGITNAWKYYKMCNGDNNKKYGTRADFFQSIAESMVGRTMNWSTILEQEMSDNNKNNVSDGQTDNGGTSISIPYPTEFCMRSCSSACTTGYNINKKESMSNLQLRNASI
jgi:hypothetical protein